MSQKQTIAHLKYLLRLEQERRKKEQAYITELIQEKKWLLSEIIRLDTK